MDDIRSLSCASILYTNPHIYPLESRTFNEMSKIEHDLTILSKHVDIDDVFAPMRAEIFHGANPDKSVEVVKIFYRLGVSLRRIKYYLLNSLGNGYMLNPDSIRTLHGIEFSPSEILKFIGVPMAEAYRKNGQSAISAQIGALKEAGLSFEELREYYLADDKKRMPSPSFLMVLGALYTASA